MEIRDRIIGHKWPLAIAALLAAAYVAAGGGVVLGLVGLALMALAILSDRRDAHGHHGVRGPVAGMPAGSYSIDPAIAALVRAFPDPAVLLRHDGRVLVQNDRAAEIIGEVPQGHLITGVLRAPEVAQALRSARDSGDEVEVFYIERSPIERGFTAHVAPVGQIMLANAGDEQGQPALLLVLRDMTQQQKLERMRADFVANASHELRTPLASLTGFIETLQGSAREDPEARERFLEIMRSQAWRMSRLIEDLLSLSRIELNAHLRPRDHVDIAEVLSFVVDSMAPLSREEGVKLDYAPQVSEAVVLGERDELVQVFQNLIENAVKYGQSGGKVEIGLRQVSGHGAKPGFCISVRDYGPGISPLDLPRLTERFYRVDVASSRSKGGTGLGLAIVKHILNRHKGTLDIRSTLGQGAEFEVVLDAVNGVGETGPA